MNEFIKKIIDKLEEEKDIAYADFDKYVEDYELDLDDDYDDFYHKGLERAIDILNQLAKEYNNGWIPCIRGVFSTSEVLVCKEDGTIDFDVFDFMEEDWKYNSKHHKNKVVAWQPLPEPYKKEE